MSGSKVCTACRGNAKREIIHPLLYVPICEECDFRYNEGEFTIEDGNEIYCRFCGEGSGDLFLCDSCPKSFCARCIENSLGRVESVRIQNLSDRWNCLICSPQPIRDLCLKKGWKYHVSKDAIKKSVRKGVIYDDISRGRERYEIPVVNEVDKCAPPLDFVYITEPVADKAVTLTNDPAKLTCCTCTDNCRDPTRCECVLRMGGTYAYDHTGVIMNEKPDGIYECNALCSCNVKRCKNRIVGNGPHLRLEVFRCDNPLKGWGVRCKNDIPAGTFVTDYLGEILYEADSEQRGMHVSDEYLFTMDGWARGCAAKRVQEMGIRPFLRSIPREEDMDVTTLTKEDVGKYLDSELVDLLDKRGSLTRAQEIGRKLREESICFLSSSQLVKSTSNSKSKFRSTAVTSSSTRKGDKVLIGSSKKGGAMKRKILLDLDTDELSLATSDDEANADNEEEEDEDEEVLTEEQKRELYLASRRENYRKAKEAAGERVISSGARGGGSAAARSAGSVDGSNAASGRLPKSWFHTHQLARQRALEDGIGVMTDRIMTEMENSTQTFTVDGRWYGSVARFLNHNCAPNLVKQIVFVESRDLRLSRIAFFAAEQITAGTELCYDYGYSAGSVDGKTRACLCGAATCRKRMY